MKSTMDNEPTLVEAENQCRDVIHSDLIAENLSLCQQLESLQSQHDKLKHRNDLQLDTTTSLCHKLNIVHMDLEDTHCHLCLADDKIIHACDVTHDIEHKVDKAINKLKEKNNMLHLQLEQGHTPCQHKLPCHNSLSTSPFRHASSHASCHISPIAKDCSCTSHHLSPMAEDHDNMPLCNVMDSLHLLSRLTMHSTATSSITSLPLEELP